MRIVLCKPSLLPYWNSSEDSSHDRPLRVLQTRVGWSHVGFVMYKRNTSMARLIQQVHTQKGCTFFACDACRSRLLLCRSHLYHSRTRRVAIYPQPFRPQQPDRGRPRRVLPKPDANQPAILRKALSPRAPWVYTIAESTNIAGFFGVASRRGVLPRCRDLPWLLYGVEVEVRAQSVGSDSTASWLAELLCRLTAFCVLANGCAMYKMASKADRC